MNASDIQAEHDSMGFTLGWRFMMAAAANLEASDVAIVGLNPGGRKVHGTTWSQEEGSAYVVESWGGQPAGRDPLQQQVRRMCEMLHVDPNATFTAQYVPFRSNSWDELPRKQEVLEFSRRLWRWVLPRSNARLFLCLGKGIVAPEIAALLGAAPVGNVPAGWGDQTIARYRTPDGRQVLGLPHLGRFRLFGRAVSEARFRDALQ